jgi:hypothetical protein
MSCHGINHKRTWANFGNMKSIVGLQSTMKHSWYMSTGIWDQIWATSVEDLQKKYEHNYMPSFSVGAASNCRELSTNFNKRHRQYIPLDFESQPPNHGNGKRHKWSTTESD